MSLSTWEKGRWVCVYGLTSTKAATLKGLNKFCFLFFFVFECHCFFWYRWYLEKMVLGLWNGKVSKIPLLCLKFLPDSTFFILPMVNNKNGRILPYFCIHTLCHVTLKSLSSQRGSLCFWIYQVTFFCQWDISRHNAMKSLTKLLSVSAGSEIPSIHHILIRILLKVSSSWSRITLHHFLQIISCHVCSLFWGSVLRASPRSVAGWRARDRSFYNI